MSMVSRNVAAPDCTGRVTESVVAIKPSFRQAEARFGFLLVVPALLFFLVVILYPFLRSVGLSLFESTLIRPQLRFVGLANFYKLFESAEFLDVWWTTAIYVVLTTSLTVLLGFGWAIILNQSFRGRTFVRSITLLPWILPSTVTAFLWAWIFDGKFGLLNAILIKLGIIDTAVVWLSHPNGALLAVTLAKTWLSTPVAMAFLLAGLQSVSSDEIDAALMDGCKASGVVRHVLIPHLLPTIVVVIVLQAMANLQQIDTILAMTNGGPARATTVFSIEVYRTAFRNWNTGLASAIGVIWFFTIAIPACVYLRTIFKRV